MSLEFKNPILIFNPTAGGGKAKKKFEKYYKILQNEKLFNKIDICETKSKEDAVEKVVNIHNNNYDLIISIGGDGTISAIINGLMKIKKEKRLPLFPLPSGSGDSLLRDFGVNDINKAIQNYKDCVSLQLFDLLFVESLNSNFKWYCINVLGMGFVSDIATGAMKFGKKIGALSYLVASFTAISKFKPYKTEIKYNDGKEIYTSDKVFFITVSNTKYTGGGVLIAPDAKFDDNLMDVIVLHDLGRIKFLNGFLKAFKGNHIGDNKCLYFKTNNLEIHAKPDYYLMPDGDIEGSSPIKVSICPKEVSLVV